MASDKIPKPVNASKEQPMKSSGDTDSASSGSIAEGSGKMIKHAGLPLKHSGDKMPHEHFQENMTNKIGC